MDLIKQARRTPATHWDEILQLIEKSNDLEEREKLRQIMNSKYLQEEGMVH